MRTKLLYLIGEDWFFCSHFIDRAVAASAAGYDVVVLAKETTHAARITAAGLKFIPVQFNRRGLNPFKEFKFLIQIIRIYRKERPSLLHHVGGKSIIFGTVAAHFASNRPGIINASTGMGYVFTSDEKLARILRPFLRLGYWLFLNPKKSRVIFENPDDIQYFIEEGMLRPSDAVLIRGAGINVAQYTPIKTNNTIPVITVVARMLRDKGIYEFVTAAKQLYAEGLRARFVLVGDSDPQNPSSIPAEYLQSWNGKDGIEWWGWREDIAEVLRQTDIACLPSYREGLPKSLLEAAAFGLPIVTTDTVGCREVVKNRTNGFLVPVRDAKALADALRCLVLNPALRAEMGLKSRHLAETEFATEKITLETLDVYDELSRMSTSI